jgi:hypothetical protein
MTRARDIATQGGLVLLNSTTFTAQTTIQFNNLFSSTYDNYLIDYRVDTLVADTLYLKMSIGGTPTSGTTNYAHSRNYWTTTQNALNNGGSNGIDSIPFASLSAGGVASGSINVFSPFRASPTTFQGISNYTTLGEIMYARHSLSTSYDGLTFTCSNALSGTLKIYGKRN